METKRLVILLLIAFVMAGSMLSISMIMTDNTMIKNIGLTAIYCSMFCGLSLVHTTKKIV